MKRHEQTRRTVPERDIEKLIKKYCEGDDFYIISSSKTEREKIISILRENGFACDDKEDIYGKNMLDSIFPLRINFSKKQSVFKPYHDLVQARS